MKRTLGIMILMLFLLPGCSVQEVKSIEETASSSFSIVYAQGSGSGSALYRMNADGSEQVLITGVPEHAYGPAISPDGQEIAFYCHESDSLWSLYVMNLATQEVRQLTDDPKYMDWSPSWNPAGDTLFFTRSSMASVWHSELWQIKSDGSELMPVIQS